MISQAAIAVGKKARSYEKEKKTGKSNMESVRRRSRIDRKPNSPKNQGKRRRRRRREELSKPK